MSSHENQVFAVPPKQETSGFMDSIKKFFSNKKNILILIVVIVVAFLLYKYCLKDKLFPKSENFETNQIQDQEMEEEFEQQEQESEQEEFEQENQE